jgi:uncharacterized repeat protein (TIGR01451 family)
MRLSRGSSLRLWLVGVGACVLMLAAASAPIALADVAHGISFSTSCLSPTAIGSPVLCGYTVQNIADDAGDSQSIVSLVDTVHGANADVVSGNLLRTSAQGMTTTVLATAGAQTGSVCYAFVRSGSDLSATNGSATVTSASASFTAGDVGRELLIDGTPYTIAGVTNATTATITVDYGANNGSPTATGLAWTIAAANPAQDGTAANPYTNVGFCQLPFGSRVNVLSTSHYTAQAADFTLPSNQLNEDASLGWHDECNGLAAGPPPGGGNCDQDPQPAGAGSSTQVTQLPTSTSTAIHDAAHNTVFGEVQAGQTVHDFVSVVGDALTPGLPAPSGDVNVSFFNNLTCSGSPVAGPSSQGPLQDLGGGVGQLDATGFQQGPLTAGLYGFQATFPGDGIYTASVGPCEPFRVVDANIQISPATATNPVGSPHVLTGHVNVNDGTGQVNAPDGTQISFSIDSGPGSFTTPNPCTTSGGTGSCQVTLTSSQAGSTSVSAHADVTVSGLTLHRDTNGIGGNSGPATKTWVNPVNAAIMITPALANNPVGSNHVLVITVSASGGTIDAGPHTATASIVSGPGTFVPAVGGDTCTYTGGAATASCTVTISSAVTGTTVVSATSGIPVGGTTITRTTGTAVNTAAGGSDNAAKNWGQDTVVTHVFNSANQDVTNGTVEIGGSVHDQATVTRTAGTPASVPDPTGTVTFTLYDNGTCDGHLLATDANEPLASGNATSTSFTMPATGGTFSYKAHYNGDGNYPAKDAMACESFSNPVNAAITITPALATNPVGSNHVLVITVTASGGTIDAGPHTATASIVSGPGTFVPAVGGDTCTYTGGAATASCTVTISSAATGTTVVAATSDIPVRGTTITRTTGTAVNTAAGGSDNAATHWVDANIQISPATGTNNVGQPHVLTAHVNVDDSTGQVNAPDGTQISFSIDSGPGSFTTANPCTTTGGTGSCQVTLTSATAGTTTVSAHTTVSVGGLSLTRATNGTDNNSGPATKTWVASVDLSVTKTGPTSTYTAVGTNTSYTITVHNAGPSGATGVVVSDPVPAGSNLVSATPSQGSCTTAVNCSLGSLAANANATVTIVLKPTATGTLTQAASVSANEQDADTTNNSATVKTTVVGFAPNGGAFVVGDGSTSGTVTFWATNWSTLNKVSGGMAPSPFKGYALTPTVPSCGTTWSTGPGTSPPPPPGPLPATIAVIVTSKVNKSGASITGNTVHIVVVSTKPGYSPSGGTPGTGTIIATIC